MYTYTCYRYPHTCTKVPVQVVRVLCTPVSFFMSNTEIVVEVHPQLHLDFNHFVTSVHVLPKSSFLTPTTRRAPELNVLTANTAKL